MPCNSHRNKFIIEFHQKVGSYFTPLFTAPKLLLWPCLKRTFMIFFQNLIITTLLLSGFIYLFTLLSPLAAHPLKVFIYRGHIFLEASCVRGHFSFNTHTTHRQTQNYLLLIFQQVLELLCKKSLSIKYSILLLTFSFTVCVLSP